MFSKSMKKRALVSALTTVVVLVAVAVAYYSTTGSGANQSGGTTAGGLSTLQITGTATNAGALVPGGSVPISNGNIHNPNANSSARHGTITGTVDAAAAQCDDSDFQITNVTPAGSSDVIGPNGDRAFTATLTMDNDTTDSQDACKGTALTITWSSS